MKQGRKDSQAIALENKIPTWPAKAQSHWCPLGGRRADDPELHPTQGGRELGYLSIDHYQSLVKGCIWGALIPRHFSSLGRQDASGQKKPSGQERSCQRLGDKLWALSGALMPPITVNKAPEILSQNLWCHIAFPNCEFSRTGAPILMVLELHP